MDERDEPISGVEQLVGYFAAAGKARDRFRIGVEHEKIGVIAATGDPVPYDGPRGIAVLLERLVADHGFTAVREHGHVIALSRGRERITLEPGGQLELSGAPVGAVRDVERELETHLGELTSVSHDLGVVWLGVGFRPFGALDDIPWVPKGRYVVMRKVMPARGRHAHDMMKRTATVQANLDWSDEDDAERKLRAAMSVTSIVTAMFASSPIVEGRDTGFASFRARVWLETDPDRCGLLPFAFDRGGVYRRYVEWALDVPVLFVYDDGAYHESGGITFRRWMREGIAGRFPTMADWELHLSTLFPEARLKTYLEVRGADSGPVSMATALPALWRGLLYHDDACAEATALTARLTMAERIALRETVPREGLAARLPWGETVVDLARRLVAVAREGLARQGDDATALAPLEEIAQTGRAHADRIREVWREAKGDRSKLIDHLRIA